MVILSEAKDLWLFFRRRAPHPEMFRFAQHDGMELAAWCRVPSFFGCWNLEVGD
jgi:hypothetical protein